MFFRTFFQVFTVSISMGIKLYSQVLGIQALNGNVSLPMALSMIKFNSALFVVFAQNYALVSVITVTALLSAVFVLPPVLNIVNSWVQKITNSDPVFNFVLKLRNALGFKVTPGTPAYARHAAELEEAVHAYQIERVQALLKVGVSVNEPVYHNFMYDSHENAMIYAITRGRIDLIKVLLSAGGIINPVAYDFHTLLYKIEEEIYSKDPETAYRLVDLISDEEIKAYITIAPGLDDYLSIVYQYKVSQLNKTLFEVILGLARKMGQTKANWADVPLMKDRVLVLLKPNWCSDETYTKQCKLSIERVQTRLSKIYEGRKKAAGAVSEISSRSKLTTKSETPINSKDLEKVDAPITPVPVVFSTIVSANTELEKTAAEQPVLNNKLK